MAVYFGADHFVWAYQIGLLNDKQTGERFQKVSVSAWALGSVCTIISESWQIARLSVTRKEVRIILLKLIAEAESDKTSASSEILAIALLSQIVLSILDMQNEPDEKYEARVEEARKAINQRMLVLVHGIFQ
eukprot:scaffold260118_cov21-Tisochrysis_lutea.AAC.2